VKKRLFLIAGGLIAAILIGFFARNFYRNHYPITVKPSPNWEPYVRSLDARREQVYVRAGDGVRIGGELFIPNGGSERKAAVVWAPGSGDGAYHDYDWGLIETYVLDVFLSRDMGVLLTNKRGVGQSEGNWLRQGIKGRAEDVYAAVRTLKDHPSIDANRIGLVGHSQGGWVMTQTASEHDDVAFFISLVGPTTSIWRNAEDNLWHRYRCQGYTGAELDEKVAGSMRTSRFWYNVGKLTRFGYWYRDYLVFDYDPSDALRAVKSPGLFVYAQNDDLVTPQLSLDRLDELFDGRPPDHLTTAVIEGATHAFRLVNDPCESWVNVPEQPQSGETVAVLHNWLEAQGY
jgi:pimeloyl-ACP methyl ester carboxylesterase